jgi:peptidoglycan L-alanyl-D-glutamate endopeptidase CwlK
MAKHSGGESGTNMSKALTDLAPWVRGKAEAFCRMADEQGVPVRITRTYTSEAIQQALWAIGRQTLTPEQGALLKQEGLYPSSVVETRTNAFSAKDTPHGTMLQDGTPAASAFDCIPLLNGEPWWDATATTWQILYKIAETCGLDALGDPWGAFMSKDRGHLQEPGWRLAAGQPTTGGRG